MDEQTKNKILEIIEKGNINWILKQEEQDVLISKIFIEIKNLEFEIEQFISKKIDLCSEMSKEAISLKPLIQMFALPTSKKMKAMAYCVLRGMEIEKIEFSYVAKESIFLSLTIKDVVNEKSHKFESNIIWDLEILKHFGMVTLNKKPLLQGFYAFAS